MFVEFDSALSRKGWSFMDQPCSTQLRPCSSVANNVHRSFSLPHSHGKHSI